MGSNCGAVLIVDADPRFRAFASRLFRQAGFVVRGAVAGHEAVEVARKERPALVVLDVCLPDVSGFEVCQRLRDTFGDAVPIIFVSGERTEPIDRSAGLLVGGDDYLVKPIDRDELLARARRLISRSNNDRPGASWVRAPLDAGLTEREHEVLGLLTAGIATKEIARRLVVSPKTVSSHIQSILGKLGAHTRAEAVAIAYREGFVTDSSGANGDQGEVRAHLHVVAS
jgi:two-component system nitrate/nitrite response regulator NarL